MTDMIEAPFAFHNLHGGGEKNRGTRKRIIVSFLNSAKGGLGGFNELHPRDRLYMRRQAKARGLKVRFFGKNGAVWNPELLKLNDKRVKKIMTGGHVGADGVATARLGDDDRRVGPNRYALYLDFTVMVVGLNFEYVVTHLVAKSFTQHVWRRLIWRKSVRSLAAGTRQKDGVLSGDMNSPDYIDLPDRLEVPVKTPPTHGRRRYDQILRWGPHIDFEGMEVANTPSDHHKIVGRIKFFRKPRRRLANG